MKIKKLLAIILSLILAVGMVACGGGETTGGGTDTDKETVNRTTDNDKEPAAGSATAVLEFENLESLEKVNVTICHDSEMFGFDGDRLLYTLEDVEPGLEIWINDWIWPLRVFATMEKNYEIDEALKDSELDDILHRAIDNAYNKGDIDLDNIPEIIKTTINGMPLRYIRYRSIADNDNFIIFVLETKDGYYIDGNGGLLCENVEDFNVDEYFGKLFMDVRVG